MGNNYNIADYPASAIGQPQLGMSNITPARFLGVLNHTGPPVSADGAFQVGDHLLDSGGVTYYCYASGTPGSWKGPGRAGQVLARAASTAQFTMTSSTDADITAMLISFTVPADRDAWVLARVPASISPTASAQITVKITDENGVQKALNWAMSGTASRNGTVLIMDEVIAAGSGAVTRKLMANCSASNGSLNNGGIATMTLDAFVR